MLSLFKKLVYGPLFVLIIVLTIGISSVYAAPSAPFSGASPSFDAAPAEGVNYNSGDWGVADQQGAASYTFPIIVPPGRNGMAPSLALRYSSNSPLRGGIAAGWTLDLPSIERDFSLGVDGGLQYRANVGSAAGRLVEVPDDLAYDDAVAAYRINFDETFTRFFKRTPNDFFISNTWTALTADGIKHNFDDGQLIFATDPRWHITSQEDPFSNTVTYDWSPVLAPNEDFIDYRLDLIEYSSNPEAGLAPHAKVEFEYAPLEVCEGSNIPIGAAARHGSSGVDGASRLTAVKTFVRDSQSSDWRLSRQMDLSYELGNSILYLPEVGGTPTSVETPQLTTIGCVQNPLRYLTQIDVTSYAPDGTPTSVPPVTFDYNRRINTTLPVLPGDPDPLAETTVNINHANAYAQFGDSHGALSTLLDITGDGVLDRVEVVEQLGQCTLRWAPGLPGGAFEDSFHSAPLPTAAWLNGALRDHTGEQCTINGQITYRQLDSGDIIKGIISYRFIDYTGDGRLDLLTSIWTITQHSDFAPISPHLWPPKSARALAPYAIVPDPGDSIHNTPMTPEPVGQDFLWRVHTHHARAGRSRLSLARVEERRRPESHAPQPRSAFLCFLDQSHSPCAAVAFNQRGRYRQQLYYGVQHTKPG